MCVGHRWRQLPPADTPTMPRSGQLTSGPTIVSNYWAHQAVSLLPCGNWHPAARCSLLHRLLTAAMTDAEASKIRSNSQTTQYDPATKFLFVPHTVTFLVLGEASCIGAGRGIMKREGRGPTRATGGRPSPPGRHG